MTYPARGAAPRRPVSVLAFLCSCALVGIAYWIGLRGPLLLDDWGNLANVVEWLDGHRSWQSAVFGNQSGPSGRPLAMASFVLDAAWWGKDVWHFKLTNLLLHLTCGVALFGLYGRLLARDPGLRRHRAWLPVLLAVVWLALPIHASTVLYVVQRMVILSALFSLLALWFYVAAREAIDRGALAGVIGLWIGVPLLTALAFWSKENGLLVPLLALVIELAYFRPAASRRRPATVQLFFAVTLALPALLACILLGLQPQRWLPDYTLRDFSLVERLLTQPRILWNYVTAILLPDGPRLGIFHDNYPKSTGLLSPWTTLPAIFGWLLVVVAAWRIRAWHPAILVGVLLFLAGHAMESTLLALELYFEHRNYLPSIGVLLAMAGLVGAVAQRLPTPTRLFRMAMPVIGVLVLVVYLGATHGRARVWSSLATLYTQELRYNPDSPRMRSFLAVEAMEAGNLSDALEHIAVAERNSAPDARMAHSLWRVLAYCEANQAPTALMYAELERRAHGRIQTYSMNVWNLVVQRVEDGGCPGVDVRRLTDIGNAWVAHNPLPDRYKEGWQPRYNLVRLLALQSRLPEAAAQGNRAWRDSGHNNGVGVVLFQVHASLGHVQVCREILTHLEKAEGKGDYRLDKMISTFRQALERGEIVNPSASNIRAHADDAPDI